jgi:hypothetical protein
MAELSPKQDVLLNEKFTLFRTTPIFYEHAELVELPATPGAGQAIDCLTDDWGRRARTEFSNKAT